MRLKDFFKILFACGSGLCWAVSAGAETKNAGLGPIEIRPQFPLTQAYLALSPETAATLPSGTVRYSYSLAVANTFVNTQGGSNQITQETVDRGLTTADFEDDSGNVVAGFGLYLDVESQRHTLRWRRGIGPASELGFEVPFVSFSGGSMDSTIEGVHDITGISNEKNEGAYRAFSDRNQYAHYIIRDGTFVQSNETPLNLVRAEPSFHWKWMLTEGGDVMPAISLKLSYKVGDSDRSGNLGLVRSGGSDWAHQWLFAKRFDGWLVYFGDGLVRIGETNGLASFQSHRFMAMEYRFNDGYSFLFQQASQSSIFPETEATLRLSNSATSGGQEQRNASLSVPSSVIMVGQKVVWGRLHWDLAIVQDYSNFGNEVDFVVYSNVGLQW